MVHVLGLNFKPVKRCIALSMEITLRTLTSNSKVNSNSITTSIQKFNAYSIGIAHYVYKYDYDNTGSKKIIITLHLAIGSDMHSQTFLCSLQQDCQ